MKLLDCFNSSHRNRSPCKDEAFLNNGSQNSFDIDPRNENITVFRKDAEKE